LNIKNELSKLKSALIIHHWDTDGIASASLLKDAMPKARVQNIVPKIGTYQLTERVLTEASKDWDAIIVADIRLPDSDFEKLTKLAHERIILFDHHVGSDLPGIHSVRDDFPPRSRFPATSWMVKQALELPTGLRPVLGVVGDKGHLDFEMPDERKEVDRFLSENRMNAEVLVRICDLLDSNARVGDEKLVEEAVVYTSRVGDDTTALLDNQAWNRNARILEQEIDQQMSRKDEMHDGIAVKQFHSKFDIVSAIARKMAWSGKYRIAVALNSGFLLDRDQLYVRKGTGSLDSERIIRLAHEHGYSAGGKDEVVGAVLPRNESQEFLQQVLTMVS